MESPTPERIINKLSLTIEYIADKLNRNYKLASSYGSQGFGVYEIDSLLREIKLCLLLDLSQASITLTNHLLEKSLKLILIYKESGSKQIGVLSEINNLYGPSSRVINKKDLDYTINQSCSKGIITKDEKRKLNIYKVRLRNGFSHSDPSMIFGDAKIPLIMGSFQDSGKMEKGEALLSDTPFLQGVAQENLAKQEALEYYIFVYSIIEKNIHILK